MRSCEYLYLCVLSYGRLKTKENLKLLALKVVVAAYERLLLICMYPCVLTVKLMKNVLHLPKLLLLTALFKNMANEIYDKIGTRESPDNREIQIINIWIIEFRHFPCGVE